MELTRVCNLCKIEKSFSEYHKHKKSIGGISHICKPCAIKKSRDNELKNIDRVRKWQKEYREKRRDYFNEKLRVYRFNNREKHKEYSRKACERIKNDPILKFQKMLRSLVYISVKSRLGGRISNTKTIEILGCDVDFFMRYIESNFKPGMDWNNHGRGSDKWHLDHIIPMSTAKTEDDVIRLNHFINFQPLWEKENLSKSNKLNTYGNGE